MYERETDPDGQDARTPQQQRVDQLLQDQHVWGEYMDTRQKYHNVHCSDTRDATLKKPPRFKFLSEWHSTVYDPEHQSTYEGNWSDLHFWIARDHNVARTEDSWNGIQRYISCLVFVLRAAPQIRVLEIDTLFGFTPKDFAVMGSQGYTIMDPNHNWLAVDFSEHDGFKKMKSTLTW